MLSGALCASGFIRQYLFNIRPANSSSNKIRKNIEQTLPSLLKLRCVECLHSNVLTHAHTVVLLLQKMFYLRLFSPHQLYSRRDDNIEHLGGLVWSAGNYQPLYH